MRLVKLTATNGRPVWVNPDHVVRVSDPQDLGQALITLAAGIQAVNEEPEAVAKKLTDPIS